MDCGNSWERELSSFEEAESEDRGAAGGLEHEASGGASPRSADAGNEEHEEHLHGALLAGG